MKFWKRIFIYSMALFLIIFNGAGVFIIENIHKRSLDRTIKTAIDEHKVMEGTIYLNIDSTYTTDANSKNQLKDWIALVVTGYTTNDSTAQDALEFYDDNNNLIFSRNNVTLNMPRPEITEAKLNERFFIIRDIDNIHYLFVSSKFILQNSTIKLIITKDINSIYIERTKNYNLFFMLDGVVFALLAIGMYLIAKRVTKPIDKLTEASKEIAYGNYSKRVQFKPRKDEIGALSENFNLMVQATEDTIEELQNMNSSKQRFIDSLTHELKTPLTSIIGYSDLLLKGNINEDIKFTALNYISSESRRLEKLNSTLLKLILIKREDLNFEDLSLRDCIINACRSLSYKVNSKNLSLNIDIQDTEIIADKQLIVVLFINILDNAIKASEKNKIIDITGNFLGNSSMYQLSFKDYGIGIPKEDLTKIREPFYMVDKARDRAKCGVGLGLAICDEICKTHNIELSIYSEQDNGTEVIIQFLKESNIS